jgi:hypothetical protein
MAKPRLPNNTRTTTTVRTTGRSGNVRLPPNPVHVAVAPPAMIPIPYAHPGNRASALTNQQIDASLGALPPQGVVAAPYLRQQDVLGQLGQSAIEHLTQAAAYRNDLAHAVQGMGQQQGAAAAQSIGGASPEAAAAAPADAATLGGYGANAANAVGAEIGSIPGYTSQYQSKIALAMQQELDRQINQPTQTILAQKPSLFQTILDRLIGANTQVEAQNQNAQTQAADLALREAQLQLSGYNAATSRGVNTFNATTPQTTGTTTQVQNPGQDTRDIVAARDKFTRYLNSRAQALFQQHSQTQTSKKPGYYLTYHYTMQGTPGFSGASAAPVVHTGRVWIDEPHAEQVRIHGNEPGFLSRYLGLPKGINKQGAVRAGNLQPVGAGTDVTTYSGQGYGDAYANLVNYADMLNSQFGLGYSQDAIDAFARNTVNGYWVGAGRGTPPPPPGQGQGQGQGIPGYGPGHRVP